MPTLDMWSKEPKALKITLGKLKDFLWKSADILRGSIDSSDYKHYIFGLLFLKRLSDEFDEERRTVKGDPNDQDNYQFFVPAQARWASLRKISEGIGSAIDKTFSLLEEQNPKLEGVLTPIQFEDPDRLSDTTLQRLILHFSQEEYNLANSNLCEPDILGRAYEYLIKQFADDAGKKGGEFYTPNGVVRTLVKILDPQEGMRICDPTCGSGGMLIECMYSLKESGKNPHNVSLFGQEKNRNTWAIAKMNLLLHNILEADVHHGNTMSDPKLLEDNHLMLFDIVIANPMWNQKEWDRELFEKGDKFNRVKYDIPPASSGDWMWVQHMYATLNERGRMGIVLDNGALFRGNSRGDSNDNENEEEDIMEEEAPKKRKSKSKTKNIAQGRGEWLIRKSFIEDDLIEGIIALPSRLFSNTSSPGCLIVINKNKALSMREKIFFIHGEKECEEAKAQSFLEEKNVTKISETYRNKTVIENFSAVVDIGEIRENDYNLNVSRYVDILPEEDPIDVNSILTELKTIQKNRETLEKRFSEDMRKLDYQ